GDIAATLTDVRFIGVGGDSFVLFAGINGGGSITASGLASVQSGRYAAQLSDANPVTITGTKENPGWVARKNAVGILVFEAGEVAMDHIIALDNGDCGLRVDANTTADFTISDSLLAHNHFQGIVIKYAPTSAADWVITDSTFYN